MTTGNNIFFRCIPINLSCNYLINLFNDKICNLVYLITYNISFNLSICSNVNFSGYFTENFIHKFPV